MTEWIEILFMFSLLFIAAYATGLIAVDWNVFQPFMTRIQEDSGYFGMPWGMLGLFIITFALLVQKSGEKRK